MHVNRRRVRSGLILAIAIAWLPTKKSSACAWTSEQQVLQRTESLWKLQLRAKRKYCGGKLNIYLLASSNTRKNYQHRFPPNRVLRKFDILSDLVLKALELFFLHWMVNGFGDPLGRRGVSMD